jgi:pimeloyl-ACP methyl ester carboxylesterase
VADRAARVGDFALVDWLWRRWSPGLRIEDAARAALHACLKESWPAPLGPYRALFSGATARLLPELWRWRLQVPLLQLHGADDGCIAPAPADAQRRWLGDAFEQRVLPGVGHFLHVEDPARVAREVLRGLG